MLLFRIYEFTLTRNFIVAAGEEFQFDIDVIKWLLHESDDYFWLPNDDVLLESTKSDTRRKDQSKNPPTHDIHDSKLYRITHKNGRSRNKLKREETKTARAVFVKFIFHRGYNFSYVKI